MYKVRGCRTLLDGYPLYGIPGVREFANIEVLISNKTIAMPIKLKIPVLEFTTNSFLYL